MTNIEQFSVSEAKLRTVLPGRRPKDRTLVVVTDQTEIEGVLPARAKKHPQLKVSANATVHVFQVVGWPGS